MSRSFFVLVVLLAFFAPFVSAESDNWRECQESDDSFACLLGYEVDNTGNLAFEQALVDAAMKAGKKGYAAIVLERIVLRFPEQAGARLDLVVLSMAAGDNLTADYHLKILQGLPNPPPQVSLLLRELEARLKPVEQAFDSKARFLASVGLGYDTNPNLGVIADAIDLVINGSPQTLVPDGSLSPHSAFFAGLSASGEYIYSPRGLVSGNILAREYEGLGDQDSVASSARIFHKLRSNRYLEAVIADFRTGEGLYLTRVGGGARQRFGDCQCNTVGLLLDYLDGSEASSRASRLTLDLQTARKLGPATVRLYGSADYNNQPDAPWGNTLGLEVGVNAVGYFDGFRGSAGLSLYKGRDDDPYSPLFGTRERDIGRVVFKLGLSHPLTESIDLFADWSYSRQDSDVLLFEYERQVSAIGVKVAF